MMKLATEGLPPYETLMLRGIAAVLWGLPLLLAARLPAGSCRMMFAPRVLARNLCETGGDPLLRGGARQHADRRRGGARADHAAPRHPRRRLPAGRAGRRAPDGADRARLRRRADGGAADRAPASRSMRCSRSATRSSARRATSSAGGCRRAVPGLVVALSAAVVVLVGACVAHLLAEDWVPPGRAAPAALLGAGLFLMGGHFFLFIAYRIGPTHRWRPSSTPSRSGR